MADGTHNDEGAGSSWLRQQQQAPVARANGVERPRLLTPRLISDLGSAHSGAKRAHSHSISINSLPRT